MSTFSKGFASISDIVFAVLIISIPIQLLISRLVNRHLRRMAQEEPPTLDLPEDAEDNESANGVLEVSEEARPIDERFIMQNILQHVSLQFWSLFPFAIFVAGAEVTLQYNSIQGVNTVNSASQLIPLVLALGLLLHVIGNTLLKLGHGFRHAFDEDATEHADGTDDEDNDGVFRSEFRQGVQDEQGWIGIIGRFLFRVYCAFAVSYNEGEPSEPDFAVGCPKSGQYSAVDIQLEDGVQS
ncbi:hypothetical protein F4819DRAFT_202610 [Hypoxylon fuscum]|nr:hypothetical protein F4819DRAFT_202610 [Hypoxylon fuscum]